MIVCSATMIDSKPHSSRWPAKPTIQSGSAVTASPIGTKTPILGATFMAPEVNRCLVSGRRDLGADGLGQRGRPGIGEDVLEHHLPPIWACERNTPVGIFV